MAVVGQGSGARDATRSKASLFAEEIRDGSAKNLLDGNRHSFGQVTLHPIEQAFLSFTRSQPEADYRTGRGYSTLSFARH